MTYIEATQRTTAMSKNRVTDAVNFLIEAPNYVALVNEMTRIIETWDTHPMAYGGHLACLNSLIDVGLTSRAGFEKLIQLVEEKRRQHPAIRRVEYQRVLMRDRRARMNKALELHELRFGKLRGQAREEEQRRIQARWNEAKAKFLQAKGDLDWAGRNTATQEFWDDVDRKLDENLMAARRSMCA